MDVGEGELVLGGLSPICLPTQEVPSFMTERGKRSVLPPADEIQGSSTSGSLDLGLHPGKAVGIR